MARWLLVRYTDCTDPSREEEFSEWYSNVHIVDMLEHPAVLSAKRYVNHDPGDGPGKFLALYEVESEDIDKTLQELSEHMGKKREQGRFHETLKVVQMTTFRKITSRTKQDTD